MENVYTYPAYLRIGGRILTILSSIVWVILIIISLTDANSGIWFFLFGTLFLIIFGGFGFIISRSSLATIALTEDSIIFTHGSKQEKVTFKAITGVSYETKVYRSMVLLTATGRYTVRQDLIRYPDFIASLREKVRVLKQDAQDTLCIKCKPIEMYISAGVFIIISIGFTVMFWIGVFTEGISPYSVSFFSLLLLGFAGFLIYAVITYPREYEFRPNGIINISLAGKKVFDPNKIKAVSYGQAIRKTYSRYGSGVSYFIEIDFIEKKKYIRIDQRTTDFPIDRISVYIKKNYPVEGKFTEVRLGTTE